MSVANNVSIMGRITKDLQLQQTAGQNGQPGKSYVKFSVAVNRNYGGGNGQDPVADFINCSAWGKTAENIVKFFGKGRMIALRGSIQTSTYTDQQGNKKSGWTVNVDEFAFTGEPKSQNQAPQGGQQYQQPPQYQQPAPQYQAQQQYQQPVQQPVQQQAPAPQPQYQQSAPAPEMGDLQDFSFDDGNFDDNF